MILSFSSCEKEHDLENVENIERIVSKDAKSNNKINDAQFRAADCTLTSEGVSTPGTICLYCAGCSDCKSSSKCTVGDNIVAGISASFSSEEIENWGSGEVLNPQSAAFILEHYDFIYYYITPMTVFIIILIQ